MTHRIQHWARHKSSCISSRRIEHRTSYVTRAGTRSCRRQLKYYEITYNEYAWPAIHSTARAFCPFSPPFSLSLFLAPSLHCCSRVYIYMYAIFTVRWLTHRTRDLRGPPIFLCPVVLKRRQVYDFQFTGCWTRF